MGEFEVASILLKIFKNVAYRLYIYSMKNFGMCQNSYGFTAVLILTFFS